MMPMQAYIDDSYTEAVYVLAGHVSSAERWASFSAEWEKLLDFAPLDKNGARNFKFTDVKQSENLRTHLPAFWRAIHAHAACSLYLSYKIAELELAKARIRVAGMPVDWGKMNTNFTFAFGYLMDAFVRNCDLMDELRHSGPIDFYFDEQSEKKNIRRGWDEYFSQSDDSVKALFGSEPRFEDDTVFLPLQASDYFAGLIRSIDTNDLDWMRDRKPLDLPALKTLAIRPTEDQIAAYLLASVQHQLPDGMEAIDVQRQA